MHLVQLLFFFFFWLCVVQVLSSSSWAFSGGVAPTVRLHSFASLFSETLLHRRLCGVAQRRDQILHANSLSRKLYHESFQLVTRHHPVPDASSSKSKSMRSRHVVTSFSLEPALVPQYDKMPCIHSPSLFSPHVSSSHSCSRHKTLTLNPQTKP